MVNFKGLDACDAFASLKKISKIRLHDVLTPARIENCWIPHAAELSYCYAFAPVDDLIVDRLQALADEQQLIEKYRMLAEGALMNTGEGRMVLHHLARGRLGAPVIWNGQDMEIFYRDEKLRLYKFAEKVRDGRVRGSAGRPFAQVVQIGIGGSDLGPRAASIALSRWAITRKRAKLTPWFVSNVDPDDADWVLSHLDLPESLFVLVSKSGTTQETLANEMLVRERLKAAGLDPDRHMVAVTSKTSPLAGNPHYLDSFFIDDFIGGRYSTSSAVGGVIISIAYGPETFEEFLRGAHAADALALEPSLKRNPVLMDAMTGVYERNVLGWPATAVLPYAEPLSRFPAHLQQLDMESNGKSVSRAGQPLSYSTGPVVFGEPGTNGQHSFYQLLHQGTDIVPLQFIGFLKNQLSSDMSSEGSSSRQKLVSNLVAQMMAFALGKEDENPNKAFPGGRPSSLLVGDELGPEQLGALFSHFENKVMFQGFVWNINSFDQEGVQLGKVLAKKALGAISKGDSSGDVRLDALIAAVYENTRRRDRADR
ncbi:Glucose-6-phosphate isomerase [uncultured spirochete]|uniref:Glucose-6-phosphate isomerase n=1 Tax=uncultured spirochete TaxID=156406 RepID=A0A3P3XT39_9SPIR|nr:Glucose-6-phosphate isomerase [uncultured spirochete]